MLAHWIGMLGEFLNFLGTLVLAFDILLRRKEQKYEDQLTDFSKSPDSAGLTRVRYEGFLISEPGFAQEILHRRAIFLAYTGTGLLLFGFACLMGYHWVEIKDLHSMKCR